MRYEYTVTKEGGEAEIMKAMGFKVVNDARLATKYNCMQVRTY